MASQRDLAEQLLKLAREDGIAARAMLDVGAVTDAIVGFHAQQAVEKALKAVLAVHGVDFPFTHDIEGLVELCEAKAHPYPLA
jgi:HEPN domain-containing protein